MSATTINIDEETKKKAQELFKDLGMNLTTAINIFLKQAIREQGLPFDVGQTRYKDEVYQAMKDAEQGKNLSKGYNDVEEMFEDILRDEQK